MTFLRTYLAQLQDAGVKVNLGAHGQREGLAAHWELWMFVQGGMTQHEALRAVTLDSAHYIGMDHALGSLEVGKLADLAIIDGNPLANIRDSDKITHTMVGGRLFDSVDPRAPFMVLGLMNLIVMGSAVYVLIYAPGTSRLRATA